MKPLLRLLIPNTPMAAAGPPRTRHIVVMSKSRQQGECKLTNLSEGEVIFSFGKEIAVLGKLYFAELTEFGYLWRGFRHHDWDRIVFGQTCDL